MMNSAKKNLRSISIVLSILVLIVLVLININSKNFWSFDFYKIIYLGILIFISFFLTQHYTDERNRKEYILDMVNKLCDFILSINLDKIVKDNNTDYFNMKIRNIRNILDLLSLIAIKYDIKSEVDYLLNEIGEIDTTVSENSGNIDNLYSLKKTIDRHKFNMINKCDAIKYKLFFPFHKN